MIFNLFKNAKDILFNNTKSGLNAENTQDAIEELDSNLSETNSKFGWVNVGGTTLSNSKTITFDTTKIPKSPKEIVIRVQEQKNVWGTWYKTIPQITNVGPLVSWDTTVKFGDSNTSISAVINNKSVVFNNLTINGTSYLTSANVIASVYMR